MYHPRLKGNHYAMGQKMGYVFKKYNVRFPISLDPFQTKFGIESGKLLKEYYPEAAEEIKGVTDVIGYDNVKFTAWMMCMGCCHTISEEDCIEVRGCTAFSFMRSGQVYYARNNDLPPFLKKISKSIYYRPENRMSFILNTSSFINGEEGINETGLVAAMTFVVPKWDEIKPGLNSVFLVRYILENCRNVNEGIAFLKKIPIASSCNILLADRSGEMAVVECNPLKINIRDSEKSIQGEKFIVTVNHFTSKKMWKHDASDRNVFYSRIRYQTVCDALKNSDFSDGIQYAQNILSGKYGFICQYKKELNFDTIWSTVFDISGKGILRAEGNPKTAKYIIDKRFKEL